MKITLLQTGRTTDKFVAEGFESYCNRIKKYCHFEIITVPEVQHSKKMPVQEQKNKEGRKIISSLSNGDFIVLLDERGKEYSTSEFAKWMEKQIVNMSKKVVFVIGGAWGFSDEVYKIADMKISLSKMTFPHQLVRLVFAEQLYRAFTILKGEPYHHE